MVGLQKGASVPSRGDEQFRMNGQRSTESGRTGQVWKSRGDEELQAEGIDCNVSGSGDTLKIRRKLAEANDVCVVGWEVEGVGE